MAGQIVAAIGDPGVGKSRLLYEFRATSQSGWMVLETISVSHGKASAYLPIIDLLRNYFEFSPGEDERNRREKVAGRIAILDRSLEATLPYVYGLLGLVEPDDPLSQMDGQVRKHQTREAIKRILLRESLNQPLMVIFEDLHWMDPESEAMLNLLADSIGTARVLMLVNYRPEYRHEWTNKTYYMQLRLDPLGQEGAEQMLDALLAPASAELSSTDKGRGEAADLATLKRLITQRSEGNPFFIEEIIQALFEDGVLARNGTVRLVKSLGQVKMPATVQGVLASRIDRLSALDKELLQTLSVIGREFSVSLARGVVGGSETGLNERLAALQLAEFIYEQPAFSDIEYTFKHALTQEVAYNSILLERRRLIHEQAGRAIEVLFARRLPDHYSDLANHYVRSGNAPKAINYLHLAARQALSRSAYLEANTQLTAALDLLHTQVESAERDRTEIALALDAAMFMGMGATSIEGFETPLSLLERVLPLSERIGDEPSRLRILESLAVYYGLSPQHLSQARILTNELLAIADRVQDPELVGWARSRLGWLSMHEGDFTAAIRELDRSYLILAIPSPPQRIRSLDWRVHSRAFASLVLWVSGYPTRAVVRAKEALTTARDVEASATDRIFTCWWFCILNLLLRQSTSALALSEECATFTAQHELTALAAANVPFTAWALVQLGQIDSALSQILGSKMAVIELGGVFTTWLYVALVNAYLAGGQAAQGIDAADEGLELCRSSRIRMLESEIYRLKGELLFVDGDHDTAAQCFRDAIELARRQGAKSWELRATTSLTKLLMSWGRRDEAHSMLAEIYNWFTEGFDTADLKDAKALLDG
jgi:tetratricopeptide (TPR) repeat protein